MIAKLRRATLAAALSLGLAAQAQAAESLPDADDTAIRALEAQQAQSWNAHDIHAYAALFTEDADVVNVLEISPCLTERPCRAAG